MASMQLEQQFTRPTHLRLVVSNPAPLPSPTVVVHCTHRDCGFRATGRTQYWAEDALISHLHASHSSHVISTSEGAA